MGTSRCSYMTYKIGHEPGTVWTPSVFEFMEPATLTIRRRNGTVEKINYGMTERIEVLQPSIRYCNVPSEQWDTIPMPDGDEIIEWPDDLHMRHLWGGLAQYDPSRDPMKMVGL